MASDKFAAVKSKLMGKAKASGAARGIAAAIARKKAGK
jgi:hypothetical protein